MGSLKSLKTYDVSELDSDSSVYVSNNKLYHQLISQETVESCSFGASGSSKASNACETKPKLLSSVYSGSSKFTNERLMIWIWDPIQTSCPIPVTKLNLEICSGTSICFVIKALHVISPVSKFIYIRWLVLSLIILLNVCTPPKVHSPVIVSCWDLIGNSVAWYPSKRSAFKFWIRLLLEITKGVLLPLNIACPVIVKFLSVNSFSENLIGISVNPLFSVK